ncbi:type VI secretion system-associated protein TagO [Bradyrhizobium barranii]|uniref:type VI secretion system-associated protein TagO n=1 Tax=Bradyrhizobium barranii TaxID=2992140 RepID=UPI002AB10EFC|nr:type VI secretion system-associated protein TagO [Bradyrhizobium barranii]
MRNAGASNGAPGSSARNDTRMKMLIVALALGTFVQSAVAKEPDCRAIESTSGRLACYDAAFPPKAKQPTASEQDAARAAYKDPFIAEEARTAAKLKNICRGC